MARPRATSSDAIVDAAAQLFQERGYHNTSIEDIAEAANVSKPTVYQYAKSKQWILDQTLIRVMDNLRSGMHEWDPAESLDDQLDRFIQLNIDAATRLRVLYSIMLSEESQMSPALRKRFRAWGRDVTDHFADLLALYREDGRLPADRDVRVLANLFLSMFVSLHRWYDPNGPIKPPELVRMLRHLVIGAEHQQATVVPAQGR